nr:hypothetical protein BHE74_00010015 [Ipomoea trifida]
MNCLVRAAKVEMETSGRDPNQSWAWPSRVEKKPRHMIASLAPVINMAARYLLRCARGSEAPEYVLIVGKRKSLGKGSSMTAPVNGVVSTSCGSGDPSFSVSLKEKRLPKGMLPTCTRHLATENGDDAWMFRDDGKSNNEVQSRDFKVEKSHTGSEHGMVARISHYIAAGCALGG